MIGVQANKDIFSLYHLEEGELFIQDFASMIKFIHPKRNELTKHKGIVYIGSRSISFVSDDTSESIYKFTFNNLVSIPSITKLSGTSGLHFITKRITEIPLGSTFTQPYKLHDINSDVNIEFLFEKAETVAKILFILIDTFNQKENTFSFDSIEQLSSLYSFKFDLTTVKSINENYELKSELYVKQLLPLIEVPGLFFITDKRMYFQPLFKLNSKRCFNVKYSSINQLFKRKVHLLDTGIEIITPKKSLLFEFEKENQREMIYQIMSHYAPENCETNITIDKYSKLWVEGGMSNYEYLMKLNNAANRTMNDMSQYPVFPWTLNNFSSETIDLKDENNYRDLTKPIGALNPKRLEEFTTRYAQMSEPRYFYGTHYSNPAYVIGFLARKYPELMLKLHGGRFDHPDRLFYSIEIDWNICYNNCGCLKELIPEFFEENTDFLVNSKGIDFGINSKNERINDVHLPKWAKSPEDFLRIMKESLESDYVNNNIHHWIDLIFGYKQRGKDAIDAKNLFHPDCYANGEFIIQNDLMSLKFTQIHATEFGQVPKQLFLSPHPKKYSSLISEMLFNETKLNLVKVDCLTSTSDSMTQISLNNTTEHQFQSIFSCDYQSLPKFHKKKITSSAILPESKLFITGSDDGNVKIYDYNAYKIKRLISISHLPITSLAEVNNSSQIAIGCADNHISLMNTILGKVTSKFNGHDDSIISLFYSTSMNKLISDGADSTSKIWDIQSSNKVPIHAYYDTESQIVSSDFRQSDNLHICIDKDGHFVMRNFTMKNEIVKMSLGHNLYYFIKFNSNNIYQYYISAADGFKICELRTDKVIQTIEPFKQSYCILDQSHYLTGNNEGLFLYNNVFEKERYWDYEKITHMNIKKSSEESNVILIGNEGGDVYYSIA